MIPEDFDKMLDKRISEIKIVLGDKAKEYAQNNDRLHNFKVAAQVDNESPEKALWGMFKKHLVSIIDLKNGDLKPTEKIINEKIGDAINYLILLEALLKEKII